MPTTKRKSQKPAENLIRKDVLAREVARILEDEGMTQTEAAYRIKDAPSQISLIVTGKTRGFSSERLFRTLVRLGRDVDIVLRKTANGKPGKVRLTVK